MESSFHSPFIIEHLPPHHSSPLRMMEENKMREPINYSLKHANAAVDLTVADERLIVKLRTIDIPLSDLKNFCLVPTIGAQNIIGQARQEKIGDFAYDYS